MTASPAKIGIAGLGRWAKVLTRPARKSEEINVVAAFSRSEEKRTALEQHAGVPTVPDLQPCFPFRPREVLRPGT